MKNLRLKVSEIQEDFGTSVFDNFSIFHIKHVRIAMGKTHKDIGVYTEGTLIALYVASGKIFRSLVASFQWELYTRDSCVMSVPI